MLPDLNLRNPGRFTGRALPRVRVHVFPPPGGIWRCSRNPAAPSPSGLPGALEVAHQNVLRPLALGQPIEVFRCLIVGPLEIAPGALLLDDQNARPEEIDVPRVVVQFRNLSTTLRHC